MKKLWSERAWADNLYWQTQDRKTLKRINNLIRDLERAVAEGAALPAKAQRLKYSRVGLSSARIDKANRLVFKVEDADALFIVACRGHYD